MTGGRPSRRTCAKRRAAENAAEAEAAVAQARQREASDLIFKNALAALDARTARGIHPCAMQTPSGAYVRASSAEEAFLLRSRGWF